MASVALTDDASMSLGAEKRQHAKKAASSALLGIQIIYDAALIKFITKAHLLQQNKETPTAP
jgi:hypothetical protein